MRRRLLLVCALTSSLACQAAVIVAPQDVIDDYRAMLAGHAPEQARQLTGPHVRRDTVELLITVQALRQGGYAGPIRFTAADSYARTLLDVETGRADLTGTSVWAQDLQGRDLDASLPLIRDGQFSAGLFAASANLKALGCRTLAEVRSLKAVSNRAWTVDWRVLSSMRLAGLENVPVWSSMVRMVASGRVDFLLAPFQPAPDGSLSTPDGVLLPIQGVRVVLPGSRHLALSRHGPDSAAVQKAMRLGLAELEKDGRVRDFYRQSGFITPQTVSYRRLNP
ncbi:hypothetical protein [uncultured Aquitalea sp.]|uniref:hypothetical protein n=1 Tax=uncultured Aquitalea sp. TaxID=540272 RepID=UPI0025E4FD58|nr:hypothetical protein [uncultured Aquitalea sp.]